MFGYYSYSMDYLIWFMDKCNFCNIVYNFYRLKKCENIDGERIIDWSRNLNLVWDNCKL